MAKSGDVFENPVTGERAVVRQGSEDTDEDRAVVDLYVRPGGAVTGEHVHPVTEESFTVVRGKVGFRIAGREFVPELNQRETVLGPLLDAGVQMTGPLPNGHERMKLDLGTHVLQQSAQRLRPR